MPNNRTLLFLAGLAAAVGLYLYFRSRSSASDPTGGAADVLGTLDTAVSRVTNALISRGYRNNNPGNLRYVASNPWNGQVGNDGGFGVYDSPDNGTRALGRQLLAYESHGFNTVAGIISRYAPASDNNDTAAYIGDVSTALDVGPNDPLEVDSRLPELAAAIARHENGYLDSGFDFQAVYNA